MTDVERFFRRLVSNLAATDADRLGRPLPLEDVVSTIMPYRSNRRVLQAETSEEYEMVLLRLCAGEGGFVHTEPDEVRRKFEQEVESTNPDLEIIHRFEDVRLTLRPERVDLALEATTPGGGGPARSVAPPLPANDPGNARVRASAPGGDAHLSADDQFDDPVEAHRPAIEPTDPLDDDFPAADELEEAAADELEEAADDELEEAAAADLEEAAGDEFEEAADAASQCVYCGGALPGRPVNFCPHCGQSQVAMTCPRCHADIEPGWRHCVNCGTTLGGK